MKRDCVADAVPLYQYTHWNWYSFRRPRKDDKLSQPPGVLIQRPTGIELRTLGSQAATRTTEPTPGSRVVVVAVVVVAVVVVAVVVVKLMLRESWCIYSLAY